MPFKHVRNQKLTVMYCLLIIISLSWIIPKLASFAITYLLCSVIYCHSIHGSAKATFPAAPVTIVFTKVTSQQSPAGLVNSHNQHILVIWERSVQTAIMAFFFNVGKFCAVLNIDTGTVVRNPTGKENCSEGVFGKSKGGPGADPGQ